MNNTLSFDKSILFIDDIKVEFSHEIRNICQMDNNIFVLLSIPQNDNSIDNIYAVTSGGDILWRTQSLKELYPNQLNLPYEQMILDNNELRATDFYGRRYFINQVNGSILKRDFVK